MIPVPIGSIRRMVKGRVHCLLGRTSIETCLAHATQISAAVRVPVKNGVFHFAPLSALLSLLLVCAIINHTLYQRLVRALEAAMNWTELYGPIGWLDLS